MLAWRERCASSSRFRAGGSGTQFLRASAFVSSTRSWRAPSSPRRTACRSRGRRRASAGRAPPRSRAPCRRRWHGWAATCRSAPRYRRRRMSARLSLTPLSPPRRRGLAYREPKRLPGHHREGTSDESRSSPDPEHRDRRPVADRLGAHSDRRGREAPTRDCGSVRERHRYEGLSARGRALA
jgi:hypothetical protein